jgi:hypothetical protein
LLRFFDKFQKRFYLPVINEGRFFEKFADEYFFVRRQLAGEKPAYVIIVQGVAVNLDKGKCFIQLIIEFLVFL